MPAASAISRTVVLAYPLSAKIFAAIARISSRRSDTSGSARAPRGRGALRAPARGGGALGARGRGHRGGGGGPGGAGRPGGPGGPGGGGTGPPGGTSQPPGGG